MTGKRLEEPSVVVREGHVVSEAIADEHHPEDPVGAVQRRDDRVVQAFLGEVVVERVGRSSTGQQRGRLVTRDGLESPPTRLVDLDRLHQHIICRAHDAPERPLVGGV